MWFLRDSSFLDLLLSFFFFFQAEDGIRDSSVTGVQTCALPICRPAQRSRKVRAQGCAVKHRLFYGAQPVCPRLRRRRARGGKPPQEQHLLSPLSPPLL